MKELSFVLAAFMTIVWDLSQNHGAVVRELAGSVAHSLRAVGLL